MDTSGKALRPCRALTAKQREFVRSVAVLGLGPSEAYRKSYCSLGTPRSISSQAFRLLRSRSVRNAIADIQNSNASTKLIFAHPGFAAVLKIKRLHQIAQDPASPPYVKIRAWELIGACEREEASRRREEAEESSKRRHEELMQKLLPRKPIASDADIDEGLEDFSEDSFAAADPIGFSATRSQDTSNPTPFRHSGGHGPVSGTADDAPRRQSLDHFVWRR